MADLRIIVAGVVVHQARLVGLLAGVGAIRVEFGRAAAFGGAESRILALADPAAIGVGLGDGAAKVVSHCDHFVSSHAGM